MSNALIVALINKDEYKVDWILNKNQRCLDGLPPLHTFQPQDRLCCVKEWFGCLCWVTFSVCDCSNSSDYPLSWRHVFKEQNVVSAALKGYKSERKSSKQLLRILYRIKRQAGEEEFQSMISSRNDIVFSSRFENVRIFLLKNHANALSLYKYDDESALTQSITMHHLRVLKFMGRFYNSWSMLLPLVEQQKNRNVYWFVIRRVHAGTINIIHALLIDMNLQNELHEIDNDGMCLVEYAEMKRNDLLQQKRALKSVVYQMHRGYQEDEDNVLMNRATELRGYLKSVVQYLVSQCGASSGLLMTPYIIKCKQEYQQSVFLFLLQLQDLLPKEIVSLITSFF